MRRIRYQVACSLDGFIAGPNGEIDWISDDSDFDFAELFAQLDVALMGRLTWEALPQRGAELEGLRVMVVSSTVRQEDHPAITVVLPDRLEATVRALRAEPGKDIWLFGGGMLFRTLLDLGLVDTVEPAVLPVLLGSGLPLLPAPYAPRHLRLRAHRSYPSGMALLEYDVVAGAGPPETSPHDSGIPRA